jgi:hypothetical protein
VINHTPQLGSILCPAVRLPPSKAVQVVHVVAMEAQDQKISAIAAML